MTEEKSNKVSVTLVLTTEVVEYLSHMAEELGLSRSSIVRMIINEHRLDKIKEENK